MGSSGAILHGPGRRARLAPRRRKRAWGTAARRRCGKPRRLHRPLSRIALGPVYTSRAAAMQNPPTGPTAPTAQGSFARTPFPHLLVYALERALTGTFELHVGAQSVATMLVIQGVPAKLRTTEGVHFLGDVM